MQGTRSQAQALIEFGLILPIMLVLLLGMVDLGRAFVFGVSTQEGSRQAARLAATANYDPTIDDTAVLNRLIGASNPSLTGCSATTTQQSCAGGTWTFGVAVNAGGTTYSSLAAARAASALPGSQVVVTGSGSVALFPGFQTGLFGLSLGQIGVQGQTAMVIL